MTEPETGHELVITRVFDAPRHRVYRAWTDPERAARWWGPRGCTAPSAGITMDVRPGGRWRVAMYEQDGTEHLMRGVYHRVEEPELLIFSFGWEDADGSVTEPTMVTIQLLERDEKTEMIFRQTGLTSRREQDSHHEGWSSAFECLDEFTG